MASLLQSGVLSSKELVRMHIEQIYRVNPAINALVSERFDKALLEAAEIDNKRQQNEELPYFAGVPCTIKECFALEGMPNSSGMVSRRFLIAEKDATAVSRLRKAGFIPLGVSNLSELCMWYETNNQVYGRSNNPYDLRRIVGGSSGGEGALVASCASPVGLASDVAGSIRMPAFFNGVFGHKPSRGLIPNTGQFPIATGRGLQFLGTGPIVRHAEDLLPVLTLMAGPDGQDRSIGTPGLLSPVSVLLDQLQIHTMTEFHAPFTSPVDNEVKKAVSRAESILRSLGCHIHPLRNWRFKYSFDIWSTVLSLENETSFKEDLSNGEQPNFWMEILKAIWGDSPFTVPASVLAIIEGLPIFSGKKTKKMLRYREELKKELEERLGPNGVLLCPTHPIPAPLHGEPLTKPLNFVYTAIFNALGLPVTQVPMGLSSKGLPVGVQVVGAEGNDRLTIKVAEILAANGAKWEPPPVFYENAVFDYQG